MSRCVLKFRLGDIVKDRYYKDNNIYKIIEVKNNQYRLSRWPDIWLSEYFINQVYIKVEHIFEVVKRKYLTSK